MRLPKILVLIICYLAVRLTVRGVSATRRLYLGLSLYIPPGAVWNTTDLVRGWVIIDSTPVDIIRLTGHTLLSSTVAASSAWRGAGRWTTLRVDLTRYTSGLSTTYDLVLGMARRVQPFSILPITCNR